jgi:transporter family-2 protein
MYLVLLAAAVLVGCLLAVQASVNQQLNKAVGTPYGASTLQLTVAAVALAVLAAAVGALGAVEQVPDVEPWWLLLGGVASPLYITAGILLFPRLGALTAVGLFVTGQVFASLGLDLFGLLAVPRQPLSIGIILGVLAVLVGITVIIRGQQLAQRVGGPGTATRSVTAAPPGRAAARSGWIVLGLLAGAVLPIQGAINAQLKTDIGRPLAVGTISFVVATLTIAIVLVILLALRWTPTPQLRPLSGMPWWGWLGGFCAAAYVTATFLLIPTIGAAVTVALTVTGQQLASALIDQFGLFRMPRRPLTAPRVGGLVLLIAGSVLIQLT